MKKKNPLVVVLDDDVAVRDSLAFTLNVEGFDVITFSSPKRLLERTWAEDATCVITNYTMPELNGLQVITELRSHYPRLPIALISGAVTRDLRLRAIAAGAFMVIDKPLLDDALIAFVRAACDDA